MGFLVVLGQQGKGQKVHLHWGLNYSGHFSPHEKNETLKDGVFITHCRNIGSKLMGRILGMAKKWDKSYG